MKSVVRDFLVLMVLAWLALNVSMFGVSERVDKYLQDVVNTHLGSVIYPYPPHPDVTVVLLTDHSLSSEELGGRWPAAYDFHGSVLKAIRVQKPKAVFIDFLWLSERTQYSDGGNDGEGLLSQLRAFKKDAIPVYLAYTQGTQEIWPEFDQEGLVRWVGVTLAHDVSDFVSRYYPVKEVMKAPKDGEPEVFVQTAAFKVIGDLYPEYLPQVPSNTMDLIWGTSINPLNDYIKSEAKQQPARYLDPRILSSGFTGMSDMVPFSTTLLVRDLKRPVDQSTELVEYWQQTYLNDKIVLYGANVLGVNDTVFTPTRKIQAGVFLHAMAMENLLNFRGEYKSEHGRFANAKVSVHTVISLLALSPVVLIVCLVHGIRKGTLPEMRYSLAWLRAALRWWDRHAWLGNVLITVGLLFWFGLVAWAEYFYLSYSTSVLFGYLQVIAIGFFLEKTQMLDKAGSVMSSGLQFIRKLSGRH